MKKILALTVLASIVATPAMAETFTRDGETFSYAVKDSGKYKLITGRNISTGQIFALRVRNGRVSGDYNGHAVSFAAPAKADELASR